MFGKMRYRDAFKKCRKVLVTPTWLQHAGTAEYSLAVYIIMSVFVCIIRSCAARKAVGSLDMSIV